MSAPPLASILPVKVELPATLKLVPFNNCKLSLLNSAVTVSDPAL